jgi:DNA mismatch repair protein MutS
MSGRDYTGNEYVIKASLERYIIIPSRDFAMALIKEYFALTEKYTAEYGANTVVLLQVGAFFEVYGQIITPADDGPSAGTGTVSCSGSRIDDFCLICELAKANKTTGFLMAGFRDYNLDKYLKKLQDAGYTTVVYVQDGVKNPPVRVLQGIYSPGTFFSTDITPGGGGGSALSNNIACIWIEKISRSIGNGVGSGGAVLIMGMTNIDIYTGRSTIFETENKDTHNPTTYDEVERFISSYTPSEVILISNLSTREVEDVIHYTNIQAKIIHRIAAGGGKADRCSKQVYQMEVLATFFPDGRAKSLEQSFMNYEIATQSLVFLLNFIYEHNPNLVSKIQEPVFENMSERLVLANHSLRQLNIIDDWNSGEGRGHNTRLSSVLSLLNHTITPMGSRAYKYALLHPTFCAEKLEQDYVITEHMLLVGGGGGGVVNADVMRERLSYMKDIEKLHRHIILRKITPYYIFCLFHNLRHIRDLYTACLNDSCLTKYLFERWNIQNDVVGKSTLLLDLFEKTLNIELCRGVTDTLFETNVIQRGISAELDKLTNEYRMTQKSLDEVQRVLNELIQAGERPASAAAAATTMGSTDTAEYVKIHETDKMGISLQATKRRTKILEDRIKKLPQGAGKVIMINLNDGGGSGGAPRVYAFDTSALTYPAASGSNNSIHSQQIYELCASVVSLRVKISDMVSLLYYSFIESLHEYYHDFENMTAFVSAVDIIQNRCYVARKYRYCRPVIADADTDADADAAAAAAPPSFVRATGLRHCLIERINEEECYVTNDVELGGTGMLLYGTNAVGKTSLIRSIGVAVIMAQAGFYVPASSFVYRPYRAIMTRILGNDNLFKGLSTFVVEMSELRVILRMADVNTLVLGDELCSGTEMDSAISIFVAGLQHLYRAGASFIFATHLHEIAAYSEIREMSARLRLAHMRVFYDKTRDTLIYDRKLQDGAGESMYGLEVCKSLHLPDDFLENANNIRVKYRGVSAKTPTASILDDAVPSRYNAAKLRRLCELCEKARGTEVHHLQHQESADADNFIGHIHKNHPANLASVCEDCHREIHTTGVEHVKVKTGKGVRIVAKRIVGGRPPPPPPQQH